MAVKPPLWKGYKLEELRRMPDYRLGYRGRLEPGGGATQKERAAYALGESEAALTRNFNRIFWAGRKG